MLWCWVKMHARAREGSHRFGPTEARRSVEEEAEASEPQSDTVGPQSATQGSQRLTLRGLRRRIFG